MGNADGKVHLPNFSPCASSPIYKLGIVKGYLLIVIGVSIDCSPLSLLLATNN